MKIKIAIITIMGICLGVNAQVYKNLNSNTLYNHFIRDGNGAVLYINQISSATDKPILRLSSGTATPNQNVRFTVENNGSVGIGTLETGTHKLAVSGTISTGTIHSTAFKSKNTNTDYTHFIRNGVGAAVYMNQTSSATDKPILSLSSGTATPNQNVRFTVENNGSVGIGTTNLGSWKLAVNGNIRAKEIKVETGWSDYVFEDGYKLPTLKEVENHINEKGHLKDIPSAKEVEKNGIFLGEMDSKLLQKIEELTLYTINQEKKIKFLEKQNSRIEKLEKVNKSLKTMNLKIIELQKRLEKLEN